MFLLLLPTPSSFVFLNVGSNTLQAVIPRREKMNLTLHKFLRSNFDIATALAIFESAITVVLLSR